MNDVSTNQVRDRIASWIKLKNEHTAVAKAFKEVDQWLTKAREDGLLDEYFDQMAFDESDPPVYRYDCPGVTFTKTIVYRWRIEDYSPQLREAIEREKQDRCPQPTIQWRAKLK